MVPPMNKQEDDKSNVVEITTYALTGTFVITCLARQVMKSIVFRKLALDDLFILLATVGAVVIDATSTNVNRYQRLVYQ